MMTKFISGDFYLFYFFFFQTQILTWFDRQEAKMQRHEAHNGGMILLAPLVYRSRDENALKVTVSQKKIGTQNHP
jgi:hypothetical protein